MQEVNHYGGENAFDRATHCIPKGT
jgi:hypothetical protein